MTYTNNQRWEMGWIRQELSRARQDVGGMRPEGRMREEVKGQQEEQATANYEVDLVFSIFLIWMTMEGAGLPYPVQAVEDPQEGLKEYKQRVIGRIC